MVFSDRTFLFLFLPLALVVLYLTRRLGVHIFGIIFLSLIFYYYSSGLLVLLLIATGLAAWAGGLILSRSRNRTLLGAIIALILSALLYFKYAFFFGTSLGLSDGDAGYDILKSIILPIGISFYTFQAISYVIDVWRGTVPAEKNPFRFVAYLTFFPQLIAGRCLKLVVTVDAPHTTEIFLPPFAGSNNQRKWQAGRSISKKLTVGRNEIDIILPAGLTGDALRFDPINAKAKFTIDTVALGTVDDVAATN